MSDTQTLIERGEKLCAEVKALREAVREALEDVNRIGAEIDELRRESSQPRG
jgi:outer membrane murein-binding lipoprotein Lpp